MATPPPYRGPSSFGHKLLIVVIVFTALACAFVGARIYTRLRRVGRLAADDWSILVSLLLMFGFAAEIVLLIERGGLGWPETSVSPEQKEFFYKVYYSNTISYGLISASYKFSVLLLYRRIFAIRSFQIAINAILALLTAWTITVVTTAVFIAWPIAYNWKDVPGGHFTINLHSGYWALGISNLVIDALILFMPGPWIWRLQMSRKKKFAVMGGFLLGGFVVIASLLRILSLRDLDYNNVMGTSGHLSLWSSVEVSNGIISACLPTLSPFKRVKKKTPSYSPEAYKSSMRQNTINSTMRKFSDDELMGRALTGWGSDASGAVQAPPPLVIKSRPSRTMYGASPSLIRKWREPKSLPGSGKVSRESTLSRSSAKTKRSAAESQPSSLIAARPDSNTPSISTDSLNTELERRWREEAMDALEVVMTREVRIERTAI